MAAMLSRARRRPGDTGRHDMDDHWYGQPRKGRRAQRRRERHQLRAEGMGRVA